MTTDLTTAEDWKQRAQEWKAIADAEATRCAKEYGAEIFRLKTEIKRRKRMYEALTGKATLAYRPEHLAQAEPAP